MEKKNWCCFFFYCHCAVSGFFFVFVDFSNSLCLLLSLLDGWKRVITFCHDLYTCIRRESNRIESIYIQTSVCFKKTTTSLVVQLRRNFNSCNSLYNYSQSDVTRERVREWESERVNQNMFSSSSRWCCYCNEQILSSKNTVVQFETFLIKFNSKKYQLLKLY